MCDVGQLELHSEFWASLGCRIKLCLKNQNKGQRCSLVCVLNLSMLKPHRKPLSPASYTKPSVRAGRWWLKFDNLNSVPGTHVAEQENYLPQLFSDLHMYLWQTCSLLLHKINAINLKQTNKNAIQADTLKCGGSHPEGGGSRRSGVQPCLQPHSGSRSLNHMRPCCHHHLEEE